jgi:hypothetical protein
MRSSRHIAVSAAILAIAIAACGAGGDDDDAADDDDDSVCSAAGFADEAAELALPSGYAPAAFVSVAATRACGADGTPSYGLADLTADELPDLVVTRLCGDATVGDSRWLVHAGGPDGFADAPIAWALPSGYADGAFSALATTAACGADGTPSFATLDLDGDGVRDLVVSRLCGDDAVGTTAWTVHLGGDAGFADEPVAWPLPPGYTDGAFNAAAADVACGADGTPSHGLLDSRGDGRVDLLISRLCGDDSVGDSRWLLHANRCAP